MEDIAALRNKLKLSKSGLLRDEMLVFISLCKHPGLTWNDLLCALEISEFTAENAALELHKRLGISQEDRTLIHSKATWERILADKGVDPASSAAIL